MAMVMCGLAGAYSAMHANARLNSAFMPATDGRLCSLLFGEGVSLYLFDATSSVYVAKALISARPIDGVATVVSSPEWKSRY